MLVLFSENTYSRRSMQYKKSKERDTGQGQKILRDAGYALIFSRDTESVPPIGGTLYALLKET